MKTQSIKNILYALMDMEWRFERHSDIPDEFVCPNGCRVPFIQNKAPKIFEHLKDCEYLTVLEILAEELKQHEPSILLKNIL